MDQYLKPGANYIRLLKEYETHKSLVIAVDYDNTLFDFHQEGHSYENVIDLLRELKWLGCYIIIFTANLETDSIVQYLNENKIPFDSINENPPFFNCDARKIYYNILLDDRAGLIQAFYELSALVNELGSKYNQLCETP